MSIQSAVNQTLGSVAGLLALSPLSEKARMNIAHKSQIKGVKQEIKRAEDLMVAGAAARDVSAENEGLAMMQEGKEKLAKIDPTVENVKEAAKTRPIEMEVSPEEEFASEMQFNQAELESGAISQQEFNTREQEAAKSWGVDLNKMEAATQSATSSLAAKQEMKRRSRRNFLDYMKDEPTSLGGKFGQLDPKLQKQIAKQYTKAEKKQIMDTADKERTHGNEK